MKDDWRSPPPSCHARGSAAHHGSQAPRLGFSRHCLPPEDREARSQAVPLTVGEPVGQSPGKRREEARFRAALAWGQASRRPYLHPHRWATRWTGCCQPLGSGLSRDRRHHRQGSPSRCHQWTWGAWWCWGRRSGIRWARGGPGTGTQVEDACPDGPLSWEQVPTDSSTAGHSFVSTPRTALEPLRPACLLLLLHRLLCSSLIPSSIELLKSKGWATPSNASLAPQTPGSR